MHIMTTGDHGQLTPHGASFFRSPEESSFVIRMEINGRRNTCSVNEHAGEEWNLFNVYQTSKARRIITRFWTIPGEKLWHYFFTRATASTVLLLLLKSGHHSVIFFLFFVWKKVELVRRNEVSRSSIFP